MILIIHTGDTVDHRAQNIRRSDELFQNVGFCRQREAIIKHFFEKFVHNHDILFNSSLGTFSKIILYEAKKKHIDDIVNHIKISPRISLWKGFFWNIPETSQQPDEEIR